MTIKLGSEWTVFHLTPSGWVDGDKQREFAPVLSRPAPPDRLLSVVNKICPSEFWSDEVHQREVWRCASDQAIGDAVRMFGSAPLLL